LTRPVSIPIYGGTVAEEHIKFRELALKQPLVGIMVGPLEAAIAALTITPEHERKVDFTHSFYATGLVIAVSGKAQKPYFKLYTAINYSGTVTQLEFVINLSLKR